MVADSDVEKEAQTNMKLYFNSIVQTLGCAEEYEEKQRRY